MKYVLKLNTKNQKISLKTKRQKITLRQTGLPGRQGEKGDKGDQGYGMPTGGLTNEVLAKLSDADFDFGYVSLGALGGDKNYVQNFTTASVVNVQHNLNKYPNVSVIDSAGDEVVGGVSYISPNQLTVTFTSSFSGRVTCN